jgi:hypothetical protein
MRPRRRTDEKLIDESEPGSFSNGPLDAWPDFPLDWAGTALAASHGKRLSDDVAGVENASRDR